MGVVVMTIVVAAVVEAFLFRIQYKNALKKDDETGKLTVTVSLTSVELSSLSNSLSSRLLSLLQYSSPNLEEKSGLEISFRGNKRRSRKELQYLLHQTGKASCGEC